MYYIVERLPEAKVVAVVFGVVDAVVAASLVQLD